MDLIAQGLRGRQGDSKAAFSIPIDRAASPSKGNCFFHKILLTNSEHGGRLGLCRRRLVEYLQQPKSPTAPPHQSGTLRNGAQARRRRGYSPGRMGIERGFAAVVFHDATYRTM